MTTRLGVGRLAMWVALAVLAGCKPTEKVKAVQPALGVEPPSVDFGTVKIGTVSARSLVLSASTQAPLSVTGATLGGPAASAFAVDAPPAERIPGLGAATLELRFTPPGEGASEATVTLTSDDPDHPSLDVPVTGSGAYPVLAVVPECLAADRCAGTATVSPPAIDFGAEAYARLLAVDPSALPKLRVRNNGDVVLRLTGLSLEGADLAAFHFVGNTAIPVDGLAIAPHSDQVVPVRFTPTSEGQSTYAATAVVRSDDPAHAEVQVALSGALRPNLPPVVCANLVKAQPADGSPARTWAQAADWAPLLVAPDAGYDLSRERDVRPRDEVTVSALSDPSDQTACTADPEDGRIGVSFQWSLLQSPPGIAPPQLSGAATPAVSLRPYATGAYVLGLEVKDTQGHTAATIVTFQVSVKQDLVAQLSWTGASGVDLDVHLVRPSAITLPADPFSGAFDFFEADAGRVSGDVNGYSKLAQANHAGFSFDWGDPGAADDPRLNVDDTGDGALVENVSLASPENDPRCRTQPCTYAVLVHYYRDARTVGSPPSCSVAPPACADGEPCGCDGGLVCVANGSPDGGAPTGAGRCFSPPKPVVRLYLRGDPTPAAVIPLETLVPPDDLTLGAPCELLHVADVVWPKYGTPPDAGPLPDGGALPAIVVRGADATGRVVAKELARFGQRGGLQCGPNGQRDGVAWYLRAP